MAVLWEMVDDAYLKSRVFLEFNSLSPFSAFP